MIILKKDNHYMTCSSREDAQEKVNEGYEVIKNSFGDKIVKKEVKKAAPKKKMFAKKKK